MSEVTEVLNEIANVLDSITDHIYENQGVFIEVDQVWKAIGKIEEISDKPVDTDR